MSRFKETVTVLEFVDSPFNHADAISSAPGIVGYEEGEDEGDDEEVTIELASGPSNAKGLGLGQQAGVLDETTTVYLQHGGKSSVYGASFNFVNSIIGAGIIGIPYALKLCGFYFGVAMLIIVAFLVDQSVIMLIECGIKRDKYDYEELTELLLGEMGYYLTTTCMFIFAYGAQVAYMVIIGDCIPTVIGNTYDDDTDTLSRESIMTIFSVLVILPLCLLKHLSSLSKTSSLSVLSDVVLVLIIVSNSFHEGDRQGINTNLEGSSIVSSTIFAGIGTISFAFVCQHNSFLVFKSLRHPTLDNWRSVAHISVGLSLCLSLLLGTLGYLSFKESTNGDILTNFPDSNSSINAARVLLAICMTFVYPMECYVSRHCICSVIDKFKEARGNIGSGSTSTSFSILSQLAPTTNPSTSPSPFSSSSSLSPTSNPSIEEVSSSSALSQPKLSEENFVIRGAVSILLWASSLLIAIVCGDLGIVLALTGALAASMLGFVIPGILYLKTHESEAIHVYALFDSKGDFFEPSIMRRLAALHKFYIPIFMVFFGFVLLILGCSTVLTGG